MFASSMVASVRSTRREAFTAEATTSHASATASHASGSSSGGGASGSERRRRSARWRTRWRWRYDDTSHTGSSHDFAKTSRHRGSSAADAGCLDDADADKIDAGSKRENTSESVAASTSSMPVETPTRGAAALDILRGRAREMDAREVVCGLTVRPPPPPRRQRAQAFRADANLGRESARTSCRFVERANRATTTTSRPRCVVCDDRCGARFSRGYGRRLRASPLPLLSPSHSKTQNILCADKRSIRTPCSTSPEA